MLEREPLEHAAQMSELTAHQRDGFWQFMDTKRGRDSLEEMWTSGKPLWATYYYIWNCMITSTRRVDFYNISIVLFK